MDNIKDKRYPQIMEAMSIGECSKCERLYYPGDFLYQTRKYGLVCEPCYQNTAARFAGILIS